MEWIAVLAIATVTVAAATYAQYRLPYLTATRAQAGWARAILMMTGLAFGWVVLRRIEQSRRQFDASADFSRRMGVGPRAGCDHPVSKKSATQKSLADFCVGFSGRMIRPCHQPSNHQYGASAALPRPARFDLPCRKYPRQNPSPCRYRSLPRGSTRPGHCRSALRP